MFDSINLYRSGRDQLDTVRNDARARSPAAWGPARVTNKGQVQLRHKMRRVDQGRAASCGSAHALMPAYRMAR